MGDNPFTSVESPFSPWEKGGDEGLSVTHL